MLTFVHPFYSEHRHLAYRCFVSWCLGHMGYKIRVVILARVVLCIRCEFPDSDGEYSGFRVPLDWTGKHSGLQLPPLLAPRNVSRVGVALESPWANWQQALGQETSHWKRGPSTHLKTIFNINNYNSENCYRKNIKSNWITVLFTSIYYL